MKLPSLNCFRFWSLAAPHACYLTRMEPTASAAHSQGKSLIGVAPAAKRKLEFDGASASSICDSQFDDSQLDDGASVQQSPSADQCDTGPATSLAERAVLRAPLPMSLQADFPNSRLNALGRIRNTLNANCDLACLPEFWDRVVFSTAQAQEGRLKGRLMTHN